MKRKWGLLWVDLKLMRIYGIGRRFFFVEIKKKILLKWHEKRPCVFEFKNFQFKISIWKFSIQIKNFQFNSTKFLQNNFCIHTCLPPPDQLIYLFAPFQYFIYKEVLTIFFFPHISKLNKWWISRRKKNFHFDFSIKKFIFDLLRHKFHIQYMILFFTLSFSLSRMSHRNRLTFNIVRS